jgi:hypothetical protein
MILKYLRAAFLNHWNLLAFLGGSAFALLSGRPDVLLAVVLAAEIAYVGLLASHPKFQGYVDAQAAKSAKVESSLDNRRALEHVLRALPRELLERFQSLRAQCLELRQIALELKRPGMGAADAPLDQYQVGGLDRLLWIHLRLLYTQYALSQFLQKTRQEQIQKTIDKLEQQLGQLSADDKDSSRQRARAALQDNLETSRDRLANWNKANENYHLMGLELDRLESKIRSLSEMAVNRQEPEFITSEVDHVASSLLDTERTMNELQFATGLNAADNEPPELLRVKATTAQD